MKATYACCLLLLACDLPELREGLAGDAAVPDAAPVSVRDAEPIPDAPAAPRSCDPAGWSVTASTSHPDDPPAHAIDGVPATRWSTGAPQSPGQWFQVDLGEVVTVDGLVIEHRFGSDGVTDYPRALDVLASNDGVQFGEPLASVTQSTDPGAPMTVSFEAHATRYLRLQLTQGAAEPWWSIHELTITCASE